MTCLGSEEDDCIYGPDEIGDLSVDLLLHVNTSL